MTCRRRRCIAWLGAALLAAPALAAQVTPQRPPVRQRPVPAGRDTVRPDSAGRDTTRRVLVKWAEPDSVMRALLARQGFAITRYQGDTVIFDAANKLLVIVGNAAVERDGTILVTDTITYNDSTKIAIARGDTIILRDPTQGNADFIARGSLRYDVAARQGTATDISTAVEVGERWIVGGRRTGFHTDTVRQETTFYARRGTVTSCDLAEPHYHFRAGEAKRIGNRAIVLRPAVLYIRDIPVMWVPFVYQDLRKGRRSGLLPPRFGLSDIVRNSSNYRRHIEGLGYYFAINDYMDADVTLDWRSGARATDNDPGWLDWRASWKYRWLDRFLDGGVAGQYTTQSNGRRSYGFNVTHRQQFSMRSNLSANVNYLSSTDVYRNRAFTAEQTFAAIRSNVNYQQSLGRLRMSLGGSQQQYSGRPDITRSFPELSLNTEGPIAIARWLEWTPSLGMSNTQRLKLLVPDPLLAVEYIPGPGGTLDSVRRRGDSRQTSVTLQTPIKIFGFTWSNSLVANELENNYPELKRVASVNDTTTRDRVYARTFRTDLDWQTGISLPAIFQGRFNFVPSVQISNTTSGPFALRNELTGGVWVRQSKRLSYALSAAPTFYGLFPGFGPVSRLRHAISPRLSYSYAPAKRVSDDFLRAENRSRVGYLGDLTQQQLTLSLDQNIEAKLRGPAGDTSDAGRKVKVVSLNFSSLSYDFERARKTGRPIRGLTTPTFRYTANSDLLPGLDFSTEYSLFEGDVNSDSARFKPFRTGTNVRVSLTHERNPFAFLMRLFGRGVSSRVQVDEGSPTAPPSPADTSIRQTGGGLLPGSGTRRDPRGIDVPEGWTATLEYSFAKQRPVPGAPVTVVDASANCLTIVDEAQRAACQLHYQQLGVDPLPSTSGNVLQPISPPTSTLRGHLSFHFTPNWSAQWVTGFDFERDQFSDHVVTLQRNLHDWRAIFSFNRSPMGNFAFSFFISLKAEPQLKFDYNRNTYRSQSQSQ